MPLDSNAYEDKLKDLIAQSAHIKKTREVSGEDFQSHSQIKTGREQLSTKMILMESVTRRVL
jgi:hypothetical protein